MLAQKLIGELQFETVSARKMLERIPNDKFDWKPHEKSMTIGRLGTHIAELLGFLTKILTTENFNLGVDYVPVHAANTEDLLKSFDEKLAGAIAQLEKTSDEALMNVTWTARMGDHVVASIPRIAAVRGFALSHFIHHRGQLSVYLRMLDIPVPSVYGPSADEMAA
jgi:uncharacterized damage-inducible protein DinB